MGTIIDFLNVTKYPPSLLYLLMTLGPAAVLCGVAERVADVVKAPLVLFGRVPFAFYVAHLYLIHGLAVAFGASLGFDARQFLTFSFFFPQGYGVGLPGVYVVWLLVSSRSTRSVDGSPRSRRVAGSGGSATCSRSVPRYPAENDAQLA